MVDSDVAIPSVRSLPTLPLTALGSTGRRQLPPPLDAPDATFWFSARSALFQGIGALGLKAGDAVALPAFCCGSEVEPFLRGSLIPRFYRLTDTLDPEPASFAAALDGAAAALATHYFGFAANLDAARAACRQRGVPFIEDCAHALYSRDGDKWLGASADVAVFSISKSLPVPDGGTLIIRSHTKTAPPSGCHPPRQVIAARTRSLVIRHFQAHRLRPVSWAAHLPSATKRRFGRTVAEPNRDSEAGLAEIMRFDPRTADTRMSERSMRLLAQTDHGAVATVRRRHYQRLFDAVQEVADMRPLFPRLLEGTCPLALPVVAADPASFRRRLQSGSGIGVKQMWPWFHPSVPWKDFAAEAHLKRSVFILPVHQSLQPYEIDRILATIRGWSRS